VNGATRGWRSRGKASERVPPPAPRVRPSLAGTLILAVSFVTQRRFLIALIDCRGIREQGAPFFVLPPPSLLLPVRFSFLLSLARPPRSASYHQPPTLFCSPAATHCPALRSRVRRDACRARLRNESDESPRGSGWTVSIRITFR